MGDIPQTWGDQMSTSHRLTLLEICLEMNIALDMIRLISKTIKYTRLSLGEEAAEAQAEEITQVLTSGKPQKEIEDKLWEISRRRGDQDR